MAVHRLREKKQKNMITKLKSSIVSEINCFEKFLSVNVFLIPLQILDAYVGPACGSGLHSGLLPLRSEQQEQAASQLAVGSLQSIWQEVS